MMARRCGRRISSVCCTTAKYLPLVFVYGLTSWAVWVIIQVGASGSSSAWIGSGSSAFGVLLYALLNISYTVAVFTNPGSTTNDDGYGLLPMSQTSQNNATSFTVKANGEFRFCKKCQARKPDRAHHCSTCCRCVLKMDHHCPWLATCIGLRNHKAFLLFLIYTTFFCFYAFAVSASWTWTEILKNTQYMETLMPVNFIMLAVMSGIIALVVGAFTAWHIMLAARGQTTIECLEKTRYLSPLRKTFQQAHNPANHVPHAAQQFVDFHANAVPGVTRPEEGEIDLSRQNGLDGQRPVAMSYNEMEAARSRKRYEDYLDEQDSSKLPNAFDLGWRRNLRHLFGPKPLLWFVPVCNTIGDGWAWEANPKWIQERDRLRHDREQQRLREVNAGWGDGSTDDEPPVITRVNAMAPSGGAGRHYPAERPQMTTRTSSKADKILGRDPNLYADGPQDVPMRKLSSRGRTVDEELDEIDAEDDAHFDEDADEGKRYEAAMNVVTNGGWKRGGRGTASGMLRQQRSRGQTPSPGLLDDGVD